ncbi:hypothetical protein [Streptomyces fuscichromogenes]|uniref:Uncharacterized protein n=1 Tax=Streptomyces fuscichromogenes TaxID=1324013 RepID=A0A918CQG0_9ACTN|nr:hypothetical protein [Streptomyces fuscichromogenes]GGN02745.1 hypothetical protein GCM10011578_025330 [Streptomyces fuscichromogenes]
MPIDLRMSLRRHYVTFLAVLVTGIVLIMAVNGAAQSTEVYLHCLLGVGGLIATYALTPPEPSRPSDPDQRPGMTEREIR